MMPKMEKGLSRRLMSASTREKSEDWRNVHKRSERGRNGRERVVDIGEEQN